MDLTDLVGPSIGIVVGGAVTWLTTRKQSNATVELNEAQAEQIRQSVYDKIIVRLEGEISRLTNRVTELESRLSHFDTALREKSQELIAVQTERDQLRVQLAATQAELQAREREIGELRTAMAAFTTPASERNTHGT